MNRTNIPPVKMPSAKQVRATVTLHSGHTGDAYLSNEVSGKIHMIVPAGDLWMDVRELKETLELLEIQL